MAQKGIIELGALGYVSDQDCSRHAFIIEQIVCGHEHFRDHVHSTRDHSIFCEGIVGQPHSGGGYDTARSSESDGDNTKYRHTREYNAENSAVNYCVRGANSDVDTGTRCKLHARSQCESRVLVFPVYKHYMIFRLVT